MNRALQQLLIGIMSLLLSLPALAQEEVKVDDIGRLPESFEMSLDSLFNRRYREYYNLAKPTRPNEETRTLDQLYRKRLHSMESAIPLTYNPIVREAIELYVNKRSNLLSLMLAKATYYFPIIESELDKQGLPLELKYLAIVESALNPSAVSRSGATGLWQFMLPTGKAYGLHIDSMVDERCDPQKSSAAMARYFKDMYALYGNWMLAIAAYNCGPGNVNKAIRRSGGVTDFWKIYQYLPRETRSYVPFFIAAFYAMEHYREHDIRPRTITMPISTDTVHIHRKLTFSEVSAISGVDIDVVRDLNPKYRREIIPGNNGTQILLLPTANAASFSIKKDSLVLIHGAELPPLGEGVALQSEADDESEAIGGTITHIVAKGETLSGIARRYGVGVHEIKSWNRLRSDRLQRGQSLRIEQSGKNSGTQAAPAKSTPKVRYHTVKRGETLSSIASKYKGVTVAQIRRANGISGNMIKPGQKLKIPR